MVYRYVCLMGRWFASVSKPTQRSTQLTLKYGRRAINTLSHCTTLSRQHRPTYPAHACFLSGEQLFVLEHANVSIFNTRIGHSFGSLWAIPTYSSVLVTSVINSSLLPATASDPIHISGPRRTVSALSLPLTGTFRETKKRTHHPYTHSLRGMSTQSSSSRASEPSPPSQDSTREPHPEAPPTRKSVTFVEIVLVALVTMALVRVIFHLASTPTNVHAPAPPSRTLPGPGDDDAPNYRGSGLTKRAYYEANPAELYRDLPSQAVGSAVRALRARGCQVLSAQSTVRDALTSSDSAVREAKNALLRLLAEEGERTRKHLVLAQAELATRLTRALLAFDAAPGPDTRAPLEAAAEAVSAALSTQADDGEQAKRMQLRDTLAATGLPADSKCSADVEELRAALELALVLRAHIASCLLRESMPPVEALPQLPAEARGGGWISWLWSNTVRDNRQRVDVRVDGGHNPAGELGRLLLSMDADIDRMFFELARRK